MSLFRVEIQIGNQVVRTFLVETETASLAWISMNQYVQKHLRIQVQPIRLAPGETLDFSQFDECYRLNYYGDLVPIPKK